jgi:uncharacterized protein DUF1924
MQTSILGTFLLTGALLAGPAIARAASPLDIQRGLESEARRTTPAFAGFSAERGQAFFKAVHGGDWTCATCHTADPRQPGRHAKTGKAIAPLAPAANPERFTSVATVDKWFKRNCNDVLGRSCTPQEKGDVLAWLLSVGR